MNSHRERRPHTSAGPYPVSAHIPDDESSGRGTGDGERIAAGVMCAGGCDQLRDSESSADRVVSRLVRVHPLDEVVVRREWPPAVGVPGEVGVVEEAGPLAARTETEEG